MACDSGAAIVHMHVDHHSCISRLYWNAFVCNSIIYYSCSYEINMHNMYKHASRQAKCLRTGERCFS